MSKTYDQAPQEVYDRVLTLIKRFHPDIALVKIRVDVLMASTDTEDAHAVTHGGWPCYATVRIVGPKERAKQCGDAEIVIDRDAYEEMSGPKRDALLDHELYHLEIVRNKIGLPKLDDYQRPKLKMRKHDFQVGWFHEIARRHKENSVEVQQAREFAAEQGQLYLGLSPEAMGEMLPTEDSVAREDMPSGSLSSITDRVTLRTGLESLVEASQQHCGSVEISAGGQSVRIDADGIHGEPTQEQLDQVTKLAEVDGTISRSGIQRHLNVSYNMACRITDRLIAAKIFGPENEAGRFTTLDRPEAHEPSEPAAQLPAA